MNIKGWFPLDWLVWSPCSPRYSQESSPAPQFESINSLLLSLHTTLTFVGVYICMHVCMYMYICMYVCISFATLALMWLFSQVMRTWKGSLLGASLRHSAHGKGHEEGGSTYTKAGSSLRSPPGNPRASTPITRGCLLYYFVLSCTPLTLWGAVPHHLFRRRS